MVLKKIGNQWALVSKTNRRKVLKYFGTQKPSHEAVLKEERRIQFFKNRLVFVRGHTRRGSRYVHTYVRKR